MSRALVTHYPFLYFQDLIDQFQFNLKTALLCRCVQHAKVKKKKKEKADASKCKLLHYKMQLVLVITLILILHF